MSNKKTSPLKLFIFKNHIQNTWLVEQKRGYTLYYYVQ